jgi:hypothetical protein
MFYPPRFDPIHPFGEWYDTMTATRFFRFQERRLRRGSQPVGSFAAKEIVSSHNSLDEMGAVTKLTQIHPF